MPGLSPKMLLRNNLVKDRGGLHETMNLSVIDEVSRKWDSSVDFGDWIRSRDTRIQHEMSYTWAHEGIRWYRSDRFF